MGNTCKSIADSRQCMAKKPLQYCKVISLQLIKINKKKKRERDREKTLESLLDCKEMKPDQTRSKLNENSPEYSLEGLTLKLKLQYFGRLKRRTNSLEKTLMLRKI